jgi:hypothetical protein
MSRKYENEKLHMNNGLTHKKRHFTHKSFISLRSKALRELFQAFQVIESTTKYIFFEMPDDIMGTETTNIPGEPRTVSLKNRKGTRITLREDVDLQQFHMFWIVPNLVDSEQILFPFMEDEWENLIEKSRQASKFAPMPELKFLSPNADDYQDTVLRLILDNTLPSRPLSLL